MDISINLSSTSGVINSLFYDSSLHLIEENKMIRYYNAYTGSYVLHLEPGNYYYSAYFENPNVHGNITCSVRKLDYSFNNAIIVDPNAGYLVGSEINILSNYMYNIETYNSNVIHNGFTRLIYFDTNYVEDNSRLDYYFVSLDSENLTVTNFGTVLAKNNNDMYATVLAFNKDDPTLVYKKEFHLFKYIGQDIYLDWNINPTPYACFTIDISNDAPYNFLQYYDWYSSNNNVAIVDDFANVTCLANQTCYIYGDYLYNDKVHLRIFLMIG